MRAERSVPLYAIQLTLQNFSTDTVLNKLKKKEAALEPVNTAFLRTINPDDIAVHIERAGEAEMDEMWSFVGKKKEQRWLWHAIDPRFKGLG